MKLLYSKVFKNYLLLTVVLFLSEIIFRLVNGLSIIDWAVLRIFLAVNIISLLLGALYSFTGRIAGNILVFITCLASQIDGVVQSGFKNYVGTYMSLGNAPQAMAVRDYVTDYFHSFKPSFWLIFLPIIILIIWYFFIDRRIYISERNEEIDFADKFDSKERKEKNTKRIIKDKKNADIVSKINAVVIATVCSVFFYSSLSAGFMQNKLQLESNKDLFFNPELPNIAVNQFGYNVYLFSDIRYTYFGNKQAVNLETVELSKPKQVESDYTRHIDDSLWEELAKKESNNNYKTLNNYLLSQPIEDKNDYTGIYKNKNLIVIMMESTTNIILNEKYYPNMYKLYSEGMSWTNNYSPRNSCSTGNNEISGMTSLFTINNACTANLYRNNKYPESIFSLFNNAGYETSSYHNYTDQYYYRSIIHPNMGSGHFYGVQELGIPYSNVYQEWPSDVELVEKVLELTKDQDKYMVWLTSVTAHQPYTQSSEYGDKYLDLFSDTNYDISLKRYMSKLKEFDNAIGELLKGLEAQGKLDDTVIVLYGDHYPYGLQSNVLNTYFDYDVTENLQTDRTPFIIYNSEHKGAKFDTYTSYINIVPTIANLWDFTDYDPRLYFGKDILSNNYEDRVIFADGSWQDDKAFYNATTGKISYFSANNTYTDDEVVKINSTVKQRINMSNLAIKTDYFNYREEAIKNAKTSVAESTEDKEN